MQSILFPTDFSENADVALKYAQDIAEHFEAKIIMLHAYQAPVIDSNMSASALGQEQKGQEMASIEKMRDQADRIGTTGEVNFIAEEGEVVQSIEKTAKNYSIDYVVMGTKGSTNASDKKMGSITAALIYCLQCPVLAIPKGAVFRPISKVVFSIDFEHFNKKTLHQLRQFAAEFDAELVLLHVNPEVGYFNPDQWINYKKTAEELLDYEKMHFEFFGEEDIVDTLNWYMKEKDGDVLAVLSHSKETIETVFQESYTKSLALHTHVPLLVFHE